jgi:hypothetical protein
MRRTEFGVMEDVTAVMRAERSITTHAALVPATVGVNTGLNAFQPKLSAAPGMPMAAAFGSLPFAVVADVTKSFACHDMTRQAIPFLDCPNRG